MFQFSSRVKNCMELVEVGGSFISVTPANNLFGHGFYQFSPRTFHSVLSKKNGFQVSKIFIYENIDSGTWQEVVQPNMMSINTTLINAKPILLAVFAKRIADVPIFESYPQQGEYQDEMWKSERVIANENYVKKGLIKKVVKRIAPAIAKRIYYPTRASFFPYDKGSLNRPRFPETNPFCQQLLLALKLLTGLAKSKN